MIRLIIVVLLLLIFAVFSLIALPILWLIGKKNPVVKEKASNAVARFMFRLILFVCGTKTTAIGVENIPTDKPVLFVGNHRGFFDVIISYTYIKTRAAYVAKKEMAKVPILRVWMRNIRCLLLDRQNTREALKSILSGIEYIKDGTSLVIFPEGTRNKTEDLMLPFKEGSFKMAEKTGCLIVPMAISGSADILEAHFPKVKPVHVIVEYGKPIDPKSLDKDTRKKIGSHCQGVIAEMLEKNNPQI